MYRLSTTTHQHGPATRSPCVAHGLIGIQKPADPEASPGSGHVSAFLLSTLLFTSFPPIAQSAGTVSPALTPYQRGLNLPYGLEGGRIRRCDSGAQPNCVSTSNGSRPQLYLPPFEAKGANATEAMNALEEALQGMYDAQDAVALIDEKTVDTAKRGLYRRYSVPSALPIAAKVDYVEVYINDDLEVFFRSQSSATKYIPLTQQPIGDGDAQKKRMLRLFREELKWKLIGGGCGVLECYDF